MWVGATLLMVPAVEVADAVGMREITAIPSTGRDRLYIWHHTIQEFYKSPIVGIGAASTPTVNAQHRDNDKSFRFRLSRHAHNMFLQNTYELGIIGAVLLCFYWACCNTRNRRAWSGIFALRFGRTSLQSRRCVQSPMDYGSFGLPQ